ncbi:helix-turn-helix domain-containing protein [Adonisia turfae]|uniref:helix-turn-helix domain-containing protein n=1 Tax=Adonisia turfae TaxID=2950184 RepID=UPI0032B42E45
MKQVLQTYDISQNQLAVKLEVDRATVYKWFHEKREPTSETIVDITKALKQIQFEAAENFIQLYLGDLLKEDSSLEQ